MVGLGQWNAAQYIWKTNLPRRRLPSGVQAPSLPTLRPFGRVGVFRSDMLRSPKSSGRGLLAEGRDTSEELDRVRPGIEGRSRGERYGDLRDRAKLAMIPSALSWSWTVLESLSGCGLWVDSRDCVIRRQRRCIEAVMPGRGIGARTANGSERQGEFRWVFR